MNYITRQIQRSKKGERGFTLTEIMVASMLFVILSTGIMFFLHIFQSTMRQNRSQMKLLNSARQAVERMVWGVRTAGSGQSYGIWEADSMNVVSANILDYQGLDGVTRRLRLNGQNIQYLDPSNGTGTVFTIFDPNGVEADDTGQYSVDITFSQTVPRVVDIEIVLGERVVGRWLYASLSTQVALRNN